MAKYGLPRLAYNWISTIGAIIAGVLGSIELTLIGIDMIFGITTQYLGILIYLVIPPIIILGLALIPIGMYRQWRTVQRTGELPATTWPVLDFNQKSQRNAGAIFVFGTALFIVMSAAGTYQAYHFSESVEFCGTTCHSVMKPEYTTYQNSPHARVACTACHVGEGAGWYTRSKLSGAYQVYAVTVNNYPRPIPTPIENLRPAQETCERCHWPEKFFGSQQRQFAHYMYDEANTGWLYNMLLKTGGSHPGTGMMHGIHWHIDVDTKVEYIARDKKRLDIPWIRVTDKLTGKITVYQDSENPLSSEELASAKPRTMDCMDCHNRPSHIFRSPDYTIDQLLWAGKLPQSLPEIKRVAVEAVNGQYSTESEALAGIAESITEFYGANYPQVFEQDSAAVARAVMEVQNAFSGNIFPEMKAKWSAYPNHIGHFADKGCLRCHDGKHVTDSGAAVSHDCNACHIILAQGRPDSLINSTSAEGLEFIHPIDIGDAWKETGCYECHTGVQP